MRPAFLAILLIPSLCAAAPIGGPGESVYQRHCAKCHQTGEQAGAKPREGLKALYPEQIRETLERGVMASVGQTLTVQERSDVSEYLSSKRWGDETRFEIPRTAYCNPKETPWKPAAPAWVGWGNSLSNSRFQPSAAAGLRPKDVPRLKLKWAFGFPEEQAVSAQPVIVGGRLFAGTYGGRLYSIDAKTGCLHWVTRAKAGLRNAVAFGRLPGGRPAVFFGDLEANVYAFDAMTGKTLWSVEVDTQPPARISGSVVFHEGKLYVPVGSAEEGIAMDPSYPCCKFRGNIVALDAKDGKIVWRTYTIAEAKQTGSNVKGTPMFGPSGAGISSAPVVDAKRGVLYVTTNNNYSDPPTPMCDSIVALQLSSGKVLWSQQGLPGRDKSNKEDKWNAACLQSGEGRANCPTLPNKDFGFLSPPLLIEPKKGPSLLIGSQKNGMLALEAKEGKYAWSEAARFPQPYTRHGWGAATDGERIYVGASEGSVEALEIGTGKVLWTTRPLCQKEVPCEHSISAAVTVIPGAVFSGSRDGSLRAHSASDGALLWDFPTMRPFQTVNEVRAKGGSIDGAGPTVAGGMVYVTSGYQRFVPGNVLLAFSVDGK